MSDEVAIRVENLSKVYRLYDKPVDRLKESIHPMRKKYHKDFYALKDVGFEVKKGETLGIIGKNGSGKSTLLKLLTGVLTPTAGNIQINGKVSALLELGTGFNPEFTGIENIYFNGTIMGHSKEEIDTRIDKVVAFADIGDFIYQPVKTYSSGMFVRLAFAVQALIDPEILIIDEALAVGDAAFSFKCINHMKKLVDRGIPVLFVTHDIQSVRSFCQKVIWLNNGEIIRNGEPLSITSEYMRYLFGGISEDNTNENTEDNTNQNSEEEIAENKELKNETFIDVNDEKISDKEFERWGNGNIRIISRLILNAKEKEEKVFNWGEKITVRFTVKVINDVSSEDIGFGFSIRNQNGLDIIVSTTIEEGHRFGPFKAGEEIKVEFSFENILAPGDYLLTLQVEDRMERIPQYYDFVENAQVFKVIANKSFYSLVQPKVIQRVSFKERRDIKNE